MIRGSEALSAILAGGGEHLLLPFIMANSLPVSGEQKIVKLFMQSHLDPESFPIPHAHAPDLHSNMPRFGTAL